jgi:hypothetical protein
MIAYQEYNTKSPLNGLAAKWAAQNPHLLPIDPCPIAPPLKRPDPGMLETPSEVGIAMAATSVDNDAPEHDEIDPWSGRIVIGSES